MANLNPFREYLKVIEREIKAGNATEHTHRPALKVLIESLFPGVIATNEPKHLIDCGAPDFVVIKGLLALGNIETKDVGIALDKVEKTDQLKRYLDALPNLILTDYIEFRWYVEGESRAAERLATVARDGTLRADTEGMKRVHHLLGNFIETPAPRLAKAEDLAKGMASIAQLIRDAIQSAFRHEDKGGTLHDQLDSFRKTLLHDLTTAQFADMYAQTICYGLFAARCNSPSGRNFDRENAAYRIPKTSPFLRDIFIHIAGPDLDDRVAWAVDGLARILGYADMHAILKGFGKRAGREDAVVHFYETFLATYDPKMRELRGVYYTPEPVVSYIVRSVDHILKTDFGLPMGLADATKITVPKRDGTGTEEVHKVQILDPACGTGTFLYSAIDLMRETVVTTYGAGAWPAYVQDHLLPRLFGFELLMAPYTVCHMKLGLQLHESGYDLEARQRLNVFLTNTLEEAFIVADTAFAKWITEEAGAAGTVKQDAPVMVVLGNPPYSGHSANRGQWITNLLRGKDTLTGKPTRDYFAVDGQALRERNPKWLNDDYVKFIRFAQWRIERTGYGILAFISNHGYLDNPTFRGMRQALMETFDDIYILDLHGNSKKKEKAPDGSKDENVFDIQQGVAIGIFVRKPKPRPGAATVHHADMWGVREVYEQTPDGRRLVGGKYHWLWEHDVSATEWGDPLTPQSQFYVFVSQDTQLQAEYETGQALGRIFPLNSVGIVTARDSLTIHWNEENVWRTVADFGLLPEEEARVKYQLGKDVRDWKVVLAQRDLRASGPSKRNVVRMLYRPFDIRWTYYTGNSRGFHCMPRGEVMRHMVAGPNLGLITTRQTRDEWDCFATRYICGHKSCAGYDINSLFPLYLYMADDPNHDLFSGEPADTSITRRPNLSPEFTADLSSDLAMTFITDGKGDTKATFGPEDVFDYMYAVFHSPTYRTRYAEFLKIDFPRLPLTSNSDLFRALCALGEELVGLHLMEKHGPRMTKFPVAGINVVDKVRYTEPGQGSEQGRVWINKAQYFEGVPPEVWGFHVGGYQVCGKWLKDRKGRTLTIDDITHYTGVVSALSETIRIMDEIDEAIDEHGGWPIR